MDSNEKQKGLVQRKKGTKKTAGERSKELLIQAYTHHNPSVEVLPLRDIYPEANTPKKKLRVCAYCRVSTENDAQEGSFELQVQDYTKMIQSNPDWEFVKIYKDKGISATSVDKRQGFLDMIEDCKAGLIDLILTKSASRFARNLVDSIKYIRLLKNLNPPVGINFTADHYNSLDEESEGRLAWLSLQAQEESARKSDAIKWGIRKRFSVGIPRCPRILGYDIDDDGNYTIVEEEAKIVRFIYDSYLRGKSSIQIADTLTRNAIPTITGKSTEWCPGVIVSILRSEKYCGDIIMQKTFVKNYLTHKTVKNTGQVPSYIYRDHHPPIVPKALWEKVQVMLDTFRERGRASVAARPQKQKIVTIKKGLLAGYTIIDPTWEPQKIERIKFN